MSNRDVANKKNGKREENSRYRKNGSNNRKARSTSNPKCAKPEGKAVNDLSWYSRNPELLAAAARVPFPYKPGMTVSLGTQTGTKVSSPLNFKIPGVCALTFAYSVGASDSASSPASIAAREMYGRIRANYSGSLEADAPDIMMYALALDQVHAYIAFLKRVYRLLNVYSPYNRDYPENVLRALDYYADDVAEMQEDKVKLWGVINTLVHMVNKFAVPDDMDLYKRHRWMNENVYLDAPTPAAQSYVFVPYGFWIVDITGETGTALKYLQPEYTGTYRKLNAPTERIVDLMNKYGRKLIDALSNWDDAYTINGYIMRAFMNGAMLRAELLNQDEILQPVFEPEVLLQISNFTALASISNDSLGITQDPTSNILIHIPKTSGMSVGSVYTANPLLNVNSEAPTAADVTIATRLQAWAEPNTNIIHAATEIPLFIQLVMSADPDDAPSAFSYFNLIGSAAIGDQFPKIALLRAFNGAPPVWIALDKDTAGTDCFYYGDVTNITVMNRQQLDEITRVCIYSEFNCFGA